MKAGDKIRLIRDVHWPAADLPGQPPRLNTMPAGTEGYILDSSTVDLDHPEDLAGLYAQFRVEIFFTRYIQQDEYEVVDETDSGL